MSADALAPVYGQIYTSLYFSTIISTALYGVTCMQACFYYVQYHNDPMRTKSFVAVIWAINTIHEALTIAGDYKYTLAGLVNPSALLNGVPELALQILFTAIVAVITQGFFIYRIYVFNGRSIFGPLIWVPLAIYQLGATFAYVTKALYIADGIQAVDVVVLRDRFFMVTATSSLAVAAGVDILIAGFLTFLLVRKRISTGCKSTAHILQRLMVFAVNAGIWTATFALMSLVLLYIYPASFLHAVFSVPLCSVYCNTLLANLNGRAYIRGDTAMQHPGTDFVMSSTSPVPDITKGDTHPRVTMITVTKWEGHGSASLMKTVANQPTTPTSESTWV